jgi:ATP-dependent helicase/nuclease subunit A
VIEAEMQRLTGWELVDPQERAWTLTPEQELAIGRRSEPLLLAAGAGSGKTSVLVERYVRAVCEDGIAPERILAITFTERAAAELAQRVQERLLELGRPELAKASERGYVGTFHGFCARLLREHPHATGLSGQHEILDEGLAARLRRRAFAQALGELVYDDGPSQADLVDLLAAYGADRARAIVLGTYAQLRSRGQRLPRLPTPRLDRAPAQGQEQLSAQAQREAKRALDEQAVHAIGLWDRLLQRFTGCYETAKQSRQGIDFDDLELYAIELLDRDPDVRREYSQRFQLLMVDEFQDVNPRQLALISALERGNMFTVGDAWQSIYGFRHADVSLFRARESQLAPLGQSLRLTYNFRGRPQLLEAVNAVFAARFGGTFTPLHAGRERAREREAHAEPRIELLLSDRRGWSDTGSTFAHAYTSADAGESSAGANASTGASNSPSASAPWREAEARALADRVAELVRSGQASPGGVAVLLRATGDIECYEQALRRRGLRTLATAGSFWTRQEVVDLLAYLRVLVEPTDEIALYGLLATPPVSMSRDDMALLASSAREQERGVWEVLRDLGPYAELCARLERERALIDQLPLAQVLEQRIEHTLSATSIDADEDSARPLANVRKLVELAAHWERTEGHDLRGFLEEAAFQATASGLGGRLAGAEAMAEPDALLPEQADEAVRLMSVHAAKGLEFDVVCVADLGRAPSVSTPDLLLDGERVGVRLIELDDPEPRPALQFPELAQEQREAQAQEEDRIVYVAMTRARERLLLSGAVDFASWPRERPGAAPIGWLGPALAPELPGLCAEAVRYGARGGVTATATPPRTLNVQGTDVPLALRLNLPGAVAGNGAGDRAGSGAGGGGDA